MNRKDKKNKRWHRALIMSLCGLSQNRRRWQILVVWFLYSLIGNGVYADDYFDRITAASNGRLTRFQQDVIMVHAEAVPLENNFAEVYQHALTRSLELWREATGGKLRFRSTPIAVDADIRIRWTNQRRKQGMYDHVGETVLVRNPNGFHVEIELFLQSATLELLEPEVMQTALLHEIGHAIGLWGHSEDANDVMYFAATAQKPTARDIATWLKVDKTPVDTPFHNQAIKILQETIQKAPDAAQIHYLIGTIYADLGDYQSAIDAFQTALAINPMLQTSATQVANIFQQKGLYNLAIKHYMQSRRRHPSPEVLGALGTLSLIQEQFDRAVDFLQQALRLAPNSATLNRNLLAAHHRWGFQMLKANQSTEAIKCFKRGLVRFPFSEILLFDLAAAYESAEDYHSALEVYERILKINPQYTAARTGIATTLNGLGAQHARERNWDEAMSLYQQALERDPNCSPARQNLEEVLLLIGWEKNQTGDLDTALRTYRKLLEINSDNAQAHNNLGIIYFKKREYDQSTAHFETALSLDADYDEAKANLNYVKRKYAFDAMKKVIGPSILLVLFLSFIIVRRVALRNRLQENKPRNSES
ncbi:tetratricopeptide repeat protein [Candidatus Poribacteria bacterium]|nr:tetratricopeptide repeat protein [Candidatus Poribacteria bacterium]